MAPSHRQSASALGSPRVAMHGAVRYRQRRFAFAAPARSQNALLRQSASGGGHPCGGQARTACAEGRGGSPLQPDARGWSLCAEGSGSVPQGPLSGNAKPCAWQRRAGRAGNAAGDSFRRRAHEACVGPCRRRPRRPCAVWSPDQSGFGPAGPVGTTLSGMGACSQLEERRPVARHCARAEVLDLVRPPAPTGLVSAFAGRAADYYGRGLLLPPGVGGSKCQICVGVRSCARRMWSWSDAGLRVRERPHGNGKMAGRSLLRPACHSEPHTTSRAARVRSRL